MAFIELNNVVRDYKVYKRAKGLSGALRSFLSRRYELVRAIDHASVSIDKGELVGLIGPNGAGKSTTIKMLCGILLPTSGSVRVAGAMPSKHREKNASRIGVVFGQRSQLYWDLPMDETFDLYKKMYRIDDARYRRNTDFFIDLLGLRDFYRTPVRQLSLGQKMRANLVVALLHDPEILYLDEPTIGLDVVAKGIMRKFIRQVNQEKGTTIILTTHDMDDIEQVCRRLVMINKGRVAYDGGLDEFRRLHGGEFVLSAHFAEEDVMIDDMRLQVVGVEGSQLKFVCKRAEITPGEAVTVLTRDHALLDLSIAELGIEDIVRKIFQSSEEETAPG